MRHFAAIQGHLDVWKLLAENLLDKNPKDESGRTPFHLAALEGHLQIFKQIIKEVAFGSLIAHCGGQGVKIWSTLHTNKLTDKQLDRQI